MPGVDIFKELLYFTYEYKYEIYVHVLTDKTLMSGLSIAVSNKLVVIVPLHGFLQHLQ